MLLADLGRIGRVDYLPFVVDDVDLGNPSFLGFFQVVFQSGGNDVLGCQVFHAYLDCLGDFRGALLDFTDQIVLAVLIQDKESAPGNDKQRYHY